MPTVQAILEDGVSFLDNYARKCVEESERNICKAEKDFNTCQELGEYNDIRPLYSQNEAILSSNAVLMSSIAALRLEIGATVLDATGVGDVDVSQVKGTALEKLITDLNAQMLELTEKIRKKEPPNETG